MILLLGGTTEAREIASRLTGAGCEVLLSVATGAETGIEESELLRIRNGALSGGAFEELLCAGDVDAVVDATHPYAAEITRLASDVCGRLGVSYYRYERPCADVRGDDEVIHAADHEDAAVKAFSFGPPVLLTTGSRNLKAYADESRRMGVPVAARVLDDEASLSACDDAGIPAGMVVAGRGPFSVEDNVALIRKFGIGVLVTKDSGVEGGAPEKLEAARLEGCRVVMVSRPRSVEGRVWDDIGQMVDAVIKETRGAGRG